MNGYGKIAMIVLETTCIVVDVYNLHWKCPVIDLPDNVELRGKSQTPVINMTKAEIEQLKQLRGKNFLNLLITTYNQMDGQQTILALQYIFFRNSVQFKCQKRT